MALVKCPECKKEISSNAGACPNCGFAKAKRKSFGCGALIVVLIAGGGLISLVNPSDTYAPKNSEKSEQQTPKKKLTPEEELAANLAKIESAELSYTQTQTSLKQYYATRADVSKNTENTAFAKKMLETYKADKSPVALKISQKSRELIPKLEKQFRVLFASRLEDSNMKNGLNMTVNATGADAKILTLKYALMSKTLVYQLQNEQNLDDSARAAGFTKLNLTNGFEGEMNLTWSLNL